MTTAQKDYSKYTGDFVPQHEESDESCAAVFAAGKKRLTGRTSVPAVALVECDFNNVNKFGELYAHADCADSRVALGDPVVVWDAADDLRYPATVVEMNYRREGVLRMSVDWTAPGGAL